MWMFYSSSTFNYFSSFFRPFSVRTGCASSGQPCRPEPAETGILCLLILSCLHFCLFFFMDLFVPHINVGLFVHDAKFLLMCVCGCVGALSGGVVNACVGVLLLFGVVCCSCCCSFFFQVRVGERARRCQAWSLLARPFVWPPRLQAVGSLEQESRQTMRRPHVPWLACRRLAAPGAPDESIFGWQTAWHPCQDLAA